MIPDGPQYSECYPIAIPQERFEDARDRGGVTGERVIEILCDIEAGGRAWARHDAQTLDGWTGDIELVQHPVCLFCCRGEGLCGRQRPSPHHGIRYRPGFGYGVETDPHGPIPTRSGPMIFSKR